jgi:hypothetical protein
MQRLLLGASLAAALVIAVSAGTGSTEPGFGPLSSASVGAPTGEIITHVTEAEGQPLTVTVVDTRQRVIAIYQLDRSTGKITPTSIRNFTWDLQMIEYNSGNPLPQDIRSGLQR